MKITEVEVNCNSQRENGGILKGRDKDVSEKSFLFLMKSMTWFELELTISEGEKLQKRPWKCRQRKGEEKGTGNSIS